MDLRRILEDKRAHGCADALPLANVEIDQRFQAQNFGRMALPPIARYVAEQAVIERICP